MSLLAVSLTGWTMQSPRSKYMLYPYYVMLFGGFAGTSYCSFQTTMHITDGVQRLNVHDVSISASKLATPDSPINSSQLWLSLSAYTSTTGARMLIILFRVIRHGLERVRSNEGIRNDRNGHLLLRNHFQFRDCLEPVLRGQPV